MVNFERFKFYVRREQVPKALRDGSKKRIIDGASMFYKNFTNHLMIRIKCFIFLPLLACLIYGCSINYSFTGASIAADVKTISIQYFANRAALAKPTLSNALTEALKMQFQSQTNLTLVGKYGDLQIEGYISDYRTAPVAIQGNETAAKNRLTISIHVKFTNLKDPEQNYETSFMRYAEYASNQNLANVEDGLINEINSQLVQDVFNKSVSNW